MSVLPPTRAEPSLFTTFMMGHANLSRMAPRGWYVRYRAILARMGYSEADDSASARLLARSLRDTSERDLRELVRGRPVFVVGAGPSLPREAEVFQRYRGVTRIAADSAAGFMAEIGARPHAVVTDLDGRDLDEVSRRAVMVVHAHGGNADRVADAARFARAVGTCQCRPPRGLRNFGGFTDGDRAAFMAHALGASEIILLGMDFGSKVGIQSRTPPGERRIKLMKLREAESLVEWLGSRRRIYSTAGTAGTVRVARAEIGGLVRRRP